LLIDGSPFEARPRGDRACCAPWRRAAGAASPGAAWDVAVHPSAAPLEATMRFILPIVMVTMFFSVLAQRVVLDTLTEDQLGHRHEKRHQPAQVDEESVRLASRDR
jgi:hypothetical protein